MATKKKTAKKKLKPRKVVRDSTTGQFVPNELAKSNPKGTVTETVNLPKKKTIKKKSAVKRKK